jgi:HrpA-like RNA helicase
MKKKEYCNIIITQPRRIAAISVARRVCNERQWKLGTTCGYQIGLDHKNVNEDTRITYVTTGVLLQKLIGPQADDNFKKYTHIILDEVHERDLDTDFALLVIKLRSFRRLDSKIILMSATIDSNLFAEYFPQNDDQFFSPANVSLLDGMNKIKITPSPIIKLEHQPFDVVNYYWEDLVGPSKILGSILDRNIKTVARNLKNNNIKISASNSSLNANKRDENFYQYYHNDIVKTKNRQVNRYNLPSESTAHPNDSELINYEKKLKNELMNVDFDISDPYMSDHAVEVVLNLLRYFDEEDYRQIRSNEASNNRIIDGLAEFRASVLIFVPGMAQIQKLQELINVTLNMNEKRNLNILPLHSDIVIEQQVQVFRESERTVRKVVISTSIAESSITMPDVSYVIDLCLTKELYCDPCTNLMTLRLEWASKSSMNQRRGRAGRVKDGICFRLIRKSFYNQLDEQTKPAILREPLSSVILNVKRLKQIGEPKKILSIALQPPKLSDIESNYYYKK